MAEETYQRTNHFEGAKDLGDDTRRPQDVTGGSSSPLLRLLQIDEAAFRYNSSTLRGHCVPVWGRLSRQIPRRSARSRC
jgi:hypothetical protein